MKRRTLPFLWLWIGSLLCALALTGILVQKTPAEATNFWRTEYSETPVPEYEYEVYLPFLAKNHVTPAPLWRFGAARARRSLLDYAPADVAGLRLGWYVDWTVTPGAPRPYGMEYVPIVRVKQWKLLDGSTWTDCCVDCPYVQVGGRYTYTVSPGWDVIRAAAQANPGMLWVIGNEIERRDWGQGYCARQDEILPEVYAIAYYEIRQAILSADPTARFAIGGVIQATPLRLAYLDRVWNAYQQYYAEPMPVDVWNVHAFVLQEKRGSWGADIPAGLDAKEGMLYTVLDNRNFSIAWEHIRAFRTWMKAKGQQNKPLFITEYGVNMPPHYSGFSPEEVRDHFMYPSFEHFLTQTDTNIGYPADNYRLVQRWNWYSLDDDSGKYEGGRYYQFFNGNLLYSGLGANPAGLSPLGRYWQAYVRTLPPSPTSPYGANTFGSLAAEPNTGANMLERQPENLARDPCAGQWIRLIFSEPSPSPGAFLGDQKREESRPVREEFLCLSPTNSLNSNKQR